MSQLPLETSCRVSWFQRLPLHPKRKSCSNLI